MRRLIICCIVLLTVLACIGCEKKIYSNTVAGTPAAATVSHNAEAVAPATPVMGVSSQITQVMQHGNTAGNILNAGLAVQDGDWIYYQNKGDKNAIYKMQENGEGKAKLNDDESYYISILNGTVYYSNASDGWKAYRMNEDGSGRKAINTIRSQDINVAGDWIYFVNGNIWAKSPGSIYKMRLDGSEMQRLTQDICEDINIVDGIIYYINWSDGGKLYRMQTDGTSVQKLNEDSCIDLNIVDAWAYYRNDSGLRGLYKMKVDGDGRIQLYSGNVYCLTVSGGNVYFCNWGPKDEIPGPLYSLGINGGKTTVIDPAKGCSDVNAVGEWIYHEVLGGDKPEMVRVKTDGSGRQTIAG